MGSLREQYSIQEMRRMREEDERMAREESERPVREAAEQLQKTARELGLKLREMVQSGPDPDFQVPASVAGKRMTRDEAIQFNAEEARKFRDNNAEFYNSPANIQSVTGYLDRNGVNIADEATFKAASERLRDLGLLEERPAEPEMAQPAEQPQAEPQPDARE